MKETIPSIWDQISAGDVIDLVFESTNDVAFLCVNVMKLCLMGSKIQVAASSKKALDDFWIVLLKARQSSAIFSTHTIEYEECVRCTQNNGDIMKIKGYKNSDDEAILIYLGAGQSDPQKVAHQIAAEEHSFAVVRVWG